MLRAPRLLQVAARGVFIHRSGLDTPSAAPPESVHSRSAAAAQRGQKRRHCGAETGTKCVSDVLADDSRSVRECAGARCVHLRCLMCVCGGETDTLSISSSGLHLSQELLMTGLRGNQAHGCPRGEA